MKDQKTNTLKKNDFTKSEFVNSTVFCTECKKELSDFLSIKNHETEAEIFERFCNCKKTGQFKGDYCSRLFIAEENEINDIDEFSNPEFPEE